MFQSRQTTLTRAAGCETIIVFHFFPFFVFVFVFFCFCFCVFFLCACHSIPIWIVHIGSTRYPNSAVDRLFQAKNARRVPIERMRRRRRRRTGDGRCIHRWLHRAEMKTERNRIQTEVNSRGSGRCGCHSQRCPPHSNQRLAASCYRHSNCCSYFPACECALAEWRRPTDRSAPAAAASRYRWISCEMAVVYLFLSFASPLLCPW